MFTVDVKQQHNNNNNIQNARTKEGFVQLCLIQRGTTVPGYEIINTLLSVYVKFVATFTVFPV